MDYNKKQNVYKIIMLVVLVAVITFIGTTLFMYRYINADGVKYVQVTAKDTKIANTLASFRKIVDKKFLGEIDEEKLLNGAIKGYIKGLDDAYTEYMTKEEMRWI